MSRRRTDPTPRKEIKPITFGKADRRAMREAYIAHRTKHGLPIPRMRFIGVPKSTENQKTQ